MSRKVIVLDDAVDVLDDGCDMVGRDAPPRPAGSGSASVVAIDLCDESDEVGSSSAAELVDIDRPRRRASGKAPASAEDPFPSELIIDLSNAEDDAEPPITPIDLTADDVSLARQMQRAFDSVDLTASDQSDDDVLLPYRNSIDRFLAERASILRVKEVFHNPHSKPGQPLYKRFLAAYKKAADKSIRLVFHGTSEENVDAICRSSLDPKRRGQNGQALGRGEYFAEDVLISLQYCKGGRKMLVFAVLMDEAGLRKHDTPGVLVCHRPGHHIPIAVLTMQGSADRVLQSTGIGAFMGAPAMPMGGLPWQPGLLSQLPVTGAITAALAAHMPGLSGLLAPGRGPPKLLTRLTATAPKPQPQKPKRRRRN